MSSIRALYGAAFFLSVSVCASMAGFTTETVVSDGQVTGGCNIALDSSNEPHIFFDHWVNCDGNVGTTTYAFRQGSTWTVEHILIGDCPLEGQTPSLVLDANDQPHVAIHDVAVHGDDEVVHATKVDSSWVVETVDSGGVDPSLAMDVDGHLHLSYGGYSGTGGLALKYAFRSEAGWSIEMVDATSQSGGYTSLALDPDGQPCIAYNAYQGNWLRFARKVDGAWITENIESSVDLYGCTSLAVDTAGTPHVAYARPSGSVTYAVRTEGGWVIETVPSVIGTPAMEIQLGLDQTGNPHIVFYDRAGKDLRYLIRSGGQWAALAVDTFGDVGKEPGFVLDENDRAYIAYYDSPMLDLKYAEGSGVTSVGDGSGMDAAGRWMRVVPNPSPGGRVDLEWNAGSPMGSDLRFTVRDVSGREIARIPIQKTGNRITWVTADARGRVLPAGVYTVELVGKDGVVGRTSAVIVR